MVDYVKSDGKNVAIKSTYKDLDLLFTRIL